MANQSIEARELQLFLMNDSDLYRQQWTPIIKNLVRKKKKGIYNEVGATALFMYLVKSGAKKYAKEYGDGKEWNKISKMNTSLEIITIF
jgi:hypothetical protein